MIVTSTKLLQFGFHKVIHAMAEFQAFSGDVQTTVVPVDSDSFRRIFLNLGLRKCCLNLAKLLR